MTEQWQELKETIIEMRDNDGTGTQQEVCKFLANLMDVLEKQMSDGWIPVSERLPKDGEIVIASSEYSVFPEARFYKEDGWEWAYEAGSDYWEPLGCVQAWMPLPEPYKIENKE